MGTIKFARNKLVTVEHRDPETLSVHGILEDHIYGLEIDVLFRLPALEILEIRGKWTRHTTPECPRALPLLQEAVGLRMDEEGFSQRVHKVVGRKACRHYANLLLECAHAAREAAALTAPKQKKNAQEDTSHPPAANGRGRPASSSSAPSQAEPQTPTSEERPVSKGAGASGGLVIDLHVHTSPASPCSSAPVDDLIREAKRIGLDGICLTDHNYVWNPDEVEALRQRHGFLVLRGNEITTDQGDMLVFGLHRDIPGIIAVEELREEVLQHGAFMIAAHPFRGFLTFGVGQLGLTPEKAMERPFLKMVDAVEVLNGKVTKDENQFASKVAQGIHLFQTGGSDAHEVEEVGIYATRFSGPIANEADLLEALKTGDYSPVVFRNREGKKE